MFGLLRLGKLLRLQALSMASITLDKPGWGSLQHTASATRSKVCLGLRAGGFSDARYH